MATKDALTMLPSAYCARGLSPAVPITLRMTPECLAALISVLHRCTQSRLPAMLVGAGLPQLCERAGNAKSYAERLFDFPDIGPLS